MVWCLYDELQKFVNTINNHVRRDIKLALNNIFKKHEPFYFVSLNNTKTFKAIFREVTQYVLRILSKHSEKFTHKTIQTKRLKCSKIAILSPPTYNLVDANNEKIDEKFYETELVKINVLVTED